MRSLRLRRTKAASTPAATPPTPTSGHMHATNSLIAQLTLAATVIFPIAAFAQSPFPSEQITTVREKAIAAEKTGDFRSSVTLWQQLYVMSPKETVALLNAARAAEKIQDYEEATLLLHQYLGIEDKNSPNYKLGVARLSAVAAKADAREAKAVADHEIASKRDSAANRRAKDAAGVKQRQRFARIRQRHRMAGWTQVVLGTVLGGAGVAAYVYAVQQANDLSVTDPKRADEFAAWDAPASAAAAAGLTLVATGVVTLLLAPNADNESTTLHVSPWLHAPGLAFNARF